METKSRYEVIAELESKKRDLIKERDGLNDELLKKEQYIKSVNDSKIDALNRAERDLTDLVKEIANLEIVFVRREEDLKREKEDKLEALNRKKDKIERSKEDGQNDHERQIERSNNDASNFKTTITDRKTTIEELIKSLDENLERFGKIVKEK